MGDSDASGGAAQHEKSPKHEEKPRGKAMSTSSQQHEEKLNASSQEKLRAKAMSTSSQRHEEKLNTSSQEKPRTKVLSTESGEDVQGPSEATMAAASSVEPPASSDKEAEEVSGEACALPGP